MDSDSSDDDKLKRLSDAADKDFISDALFQEHYFKRKATVTDEPSLKSLRSTIEDENHPFLDVKVSTGFQNYANNNLIKLLDVHLSKTIMYNSNACESQRLHEELHGVRLLKDSKRCIESDFDVSIVGKRVRPVRNGYVKEDVDWSSVAVTGERVLSKEDTSSWSNRKNAKEFRYKKNKMGVLERSD